MEREDEKGARRKDMEGNGSEIRQTRNERARAGEKRVMGKSK